MKRTFVVPEDKEMYYEKFKQFVPEVSGQLVAFIEDFVCRHEALNSGMTEQTVYQGTLNRLDSIFQGKTAKFYGILLAEGKHEGFDGVFLRVFLTKKGKFLVYEAVSDEYDTKDECSYKIYDDYYDMKAKAQLSQMFIKACEEYLNKNSTIRTYEVLDI